MNSLFDRLLDLLDKEFIQESIAPPAEVLPFLERNENMPPKIRAIAVTWIFRVGRALNSGAVTWGEFLNMLPTSFRADFERAMCKVLKNKKGETNGR